MKYMGIIRDAKFKKLYETYVVEGFLVQDGNGNRVYPPERIRTEPIKTFQEEGLLEDMSHFYTVHNVIGDNPEGL